MEFALESRINYMNSDPHITSLDRLVFSYSFLSYDADLNHHSMDETQFDTQNFQNVVRVLDFSDNNEINAYNPQLIQIETNDFNNLVEANECCSVCLEYFESSNVQVCRLHCSHYYHNECIERWLELQHTCPLCRTQI